MPERRAPRLYVTERLVPGAMEMMDKLSIEAAEASVHAGFPLDAGAALLVELDGSAHECETGVSVGSVHLPLAAFPFRDWLEEESGLPVYVDNDVNLAILGERRAGAAKACDDAVMLTIPTLARPQDVQHEKGAPVIVIPFDTPHGRFLIEVSVGAAKAKAAGTGTRRLARLGDRHVLGPERRPRESFLAGSRLTAEKLTWMLKSNHWWSFRRLSIRPGAPSWTVGRSRFGGPITPFKLWKRRLADITWNWFIRIGTLFLVLRFLRPRCWRAGSGVTDGFF